MSARTIAYWVWTWMGSFADYVLLPERLLWKFPPGLPTELACLHEPLGNAVYATLVEEVTDKSVLITGCGPSGLFAAAVARRAGASCIVATDISEYRLDLAKRLGVDHTFNAGQVTPPQMLSLIRHATQQDGVDVALEMSGDGEALRQAFQAVKNGGRISLFGIPRGRVSLDLANEIIFKGLRVYGITGRRLFDTWYQLAGLFQAGLDIRPVVTHTFPLEEYREAFELIRSGQCGKVVFLP